MNFKKIIMLIVLLGFMNAGVFATQHHTKQWTTGVVIGSFPKNDNLKYYLEPQLRFVDDPYKFHQFLMLAGLGCVVNPDVLFFAGPGWILTKNYQGEMIHEYRFWEQIMWSALRTDNLNLLSRTRLEQKRNTTAPQIAIQLRQRLWLRVPIKSWPTHWFSCFDEVFFNLNHPPWVSPRFFEQNRAFIGVGTQLTKSTALDVGYLNQLQYNTVNQVNNVLLVNFTVLL